MSKRIISLTASLLCLVMLLAGCGSSQNASTNNASKGDRVVIYTAAEDERIAYIQEELNKKFPNTEIVIQSLGTGQLLSKLQAAGKNSDCDIFYDLEVVNAEIVDENEHLTECADDDEPKGAFRIAQAIVNGAGGLIALITFLLLGFFWHGPTGNLGWASGWTVFLLPIIISSILLCIEKRRIIRFAYPIFIVALYCDMGIIGGAYGVNLWHPYWFLFLTIPIFYIIAGSLDRIGRQ